VGTARQEPAFSAGQTSGVSSAPSGRLGRWRHSQFSRTRSGSRPANEHGWGEGPSLQRPTRTSLWGSG
jgi:hypothetical protein